MNESPPTAGPGRTVSMAFVLALPDGTVVDEASEEQPLSFEFGDGTLSAGLENELTGLGVGHSRDVVLPPDQGFGPRSEDKIHTLQSSEFPGDIILDVGSIIEFSLPNGESMPGTIVQRAGPILTVDFNHPLADRQVRFSARILSID